MMFWASVAVGLLLKGLIAALFPVAAVFVYLAVTRQLFIAKTWTSLRPITGILLLLLIAAPWHILATLRNPPYFDFTMHSESGSYHGFFWFYFINEHLLRFLNLRYPRDYNTVPRWLFWPSTCCGSSHGASISPPSRGKPIARLIALRARACSRSAGPASSSSSLLSRQRKSIIRCPAYPAFALLLGSAIASGDRWLKAGTRVVAVIATLAAAAIGAILFAVRGLPTPGDISTALSVQDPNAYTLSLAHMGDLTLNSFAYLRLPLVVAGLAFAVGAIGAWRAAFSAPRRLSGESKTPVLALTLMMVLFFHAARIALVVFDPYLSSRPLAEALLKSPPGELIVDDQYYTFSSVFFYTDRRALLLNGRVNNLEYGSYAPDAPKNVFITDAELPALWSQPARRYLVAEDPQIPRLEKLVGATALHVVARSGGKSLYANE